MHSTMRTSHPERRKSVFPRKFSEFSCFEAYFLPTKLTVFLIVERWSRRFVPGGEKISRRFDRFYSNKKGIKVCSANSGADGFRVFGKDPVHGVDHEKSGYDTPSDRKFGH